MGLGIIREWIINELDRPFPKMNYTLRKHSPKTTQLSNIKKPRLVIFISLKTPILVMA